MTPATLALSERLAATRARLEAARANIKPRPKYHPGLTRYLSGAAGDYLEQSDLARELGVGVLVQPGNSYHLRVHRYEAWGGDNGCFNTQGRPFDPNAFRAMLAQPELHAARDRCLFIAAPDVLTVMPNGAVKGDAIATLRQFSGWAQEIRRAGFPVALVAQDGFEQLLAYVPWMAVNCLFIGGSTQWKLGDGAAFCIQVARLLGKHTHIGRVNSLTRLMRAQAMGAHSVDGTFLKYGPQKNLERMRDWIEWQNLRVSPPELVAAKGEAA